MSETLVPLYVAVGAVGGVLFVGQLLLTLIGAAGTEVDLDPPDDFDVPADLELPGTPDGVGAWLLGLLSFRSVSAAAAVFGVVGYGLRTSLEPTQGFAAAGAAGFATLWFVTWLFGQLRLLENDGTVSARDAVGASGTVYLPVPEEGEGKVHVTVGERTLELLAASDEGALATGRAVIVTECLDDRRVRVRPRD